VPKKSGQWGIGTRVRVTDETELGLYYLNYSDRTPLPEINAFTPGTPTPAFFGIPGNQIGQGSYRVRYFDKVKMTAATLSTTFNVLTVAAELTYKDGAPVLVNTLVNPAAPNVASSYFPTPTRAKITQLNVGTTMNLGRTPVAEMTLLLAELSYVKVGAIEARTAPGVDTLPAVAQPAFPASNTYTFGTKDALAANVTASLGYYGIFEGWDLTVPISFSQQIRGRTLTGGVGGEGDKRLSVGATVTYRGNLSLGLNYLAFMGSPNPDGASKTFRPLTDRDQVSLVAKYSF